MRNALAVLRRVDDFPSARSRRDAYFSARSAPSPLNQICGWKLTLAPPWREKRRTAHVHVRAVRRPRLLVGGER